MLKEDRLDFLELKIKKYNENLPPLKEFILPGGNQFCAQLHINRSVSRRVERACVALSGEGVSVKNWLPYLYRLSDYFFVLSTYSPVLVSILILSSSFINSGSFSS